MEMSYYGISTQKNLRENFSRRFFCFVKNSFYSTTNFSTFPLTLMR